MIDVPVACGVDQAVLPVEDRLGGRYLHLDGEWPRDAGLGIDVATPSAIATLTKMARETVRKADKPRLLEGFLSA